LETTRLVDGWSIDKINATLRASDLGDKAKICIVIDSF